MLTDIPGIGDAIADIVTKLYQTGSHPSLEKLRQEVPEGVLELFALPGLRPDKILKLHQELGVASLADLEAAASEDRLRKIKGLGAALQTKILQNLSIARSGETQLHLHKAAALLDHALTSVKSEHPEYSRIEVAGDFRRGCELVSDLALVAQAKTALPEQESQGGLNVVVTDKKHFGARLLNATGSTAHLELLKEFAQGKGFDLQPDGLYRGRKLVASATEEDIYEALNLQYIEPELREGRDEIKRAAKRELPDLVVDKDLHGILHCHTTSSDGTETLQTMAEATRKRGFEYFGVADHSQSAHYAGGLSLEEIAKQHREADRLNKRFGKSFRVLKGIDLTFLRMARSTTPTACWTNSILSSPACIAASKCGKKEQTERILKAVKNPTQQSSAT